MPKTHPSQNQNFNFCCTKYYYPIWKFPSWSWTCVSKEAQQSKGRGTKIWTEAENRKR